MTKTTSALLGASHIRELASTLGIRPTKTLGQNFVHDAGTVRRIVRDAGVRPGDVVLEVGPGLGSLTLALLEAGAVVCAVEIDPVLAGALESTVAARMPEAVERLAVANLDAMDVKAPSNLPVPRRLQSEEGCPHRLAEPVPETAEPEPESVDFAGESVRTGQIPAKPRRFAKATRGVVEPSRLVANLPYNVAVPIFLSLLEALPSIQSATVMVQAEVADRLAAPPGSRTYGVPSAKVSWYGEAARGARISRNVFWPIPNVDSALVSFRRYGALPQPQADVAGLALAGVSREDVFAVIDAAFAQRRKTLRAALATWAGSAARAEDLLVVAGIDPKARGEQLSVSEFAAIARAANTFA
mgnify:FL=1